MTCNGAIVGTLDVGQMKLIISSEMSSSPRSRRLRACRIDADMRASSSSVMRSMTSSAMPAEYRTELKSSCNQPIHCTNRLSSSCDTVGRLLQRCLDPGAPQGCRALQVLTVFESRFG